MPETVFQEVKRYTGFDGPDEEALRSLHPHAKPHFERIADLFYARILEHEEARKVLERGETGVGKLHLSLVAWLDSLLTGPYDHTYYERRARIGRVHVRIGLPQHYMFAAMNLVRRELLDVSAAAFADGPERMAVRRALEKILDLELAIMLHTYREDLLAQQARVERLSTFGQLVGSIGHELRNPLAVIETSLFILKDRIPKDAKVEKHVARIEDQLGIANDIITHLLDMIRDRPLTAEALAVADVVGKAAAQVRRYPDVALELRGLEGLQKVHGDAGQLRQVFVNLIDNAAHAASPSGKVLIRAETTEHFVELHVEDSGPGVDEAVRGRLFEPLVTTKKGGVGLGLALVRRILGRHGGTVTFGRSGELHGADFVVRLPARSEP